AGRVKIELVNFGEDPHNLKLRRVGGTHVYTVGETLPGARTTKTFRFRHGRFRYWCSVADHKELGMKGTLRVTRPEPGFARPCPAWRLRAAAKVSEPGMTPSTDARPHTTRTLIILGAAALAFALAQT